MIIAAVLLAAFAMLFAVTLPPIDGGGTFVASAHAAANGNGDNGGNGGNDNGDDGGGNGQGNDQGDDGQGDDGQGDDGQGNDNDQGDDSQGEDGNGDVEWTENDGGPDGTGGGRRDDDPDATTEDAGTGKAGGRGVGAHADGTRRSGDGERADRGASPGPSPDDDVTDDGLVDPVAAGRAATVRDAFRATVLSAEEEAAVIAAGWAPAD